MSLARVITAVTATLLVVVSAATPASASTAPDTWPQGESMSTLEWMGLFIGGTLLLVVVIWGLAAAVNAKVRHHVVIPGPPSGTAIEAADYQPLPAPAEKSEQH